LFHYFIMTNNIKGMEVANHPIYIENDEGLQGFHLAAKVAAESKSFNMLNMLIKKYPDYATNLNIYNETIENHLKKRIKYDLIIMADVIEHFNDPFKVLSQINELLNQNGKLILTTFNIDSLYAKITGKNYHWLIPFHIVFFSNRTLEIFGKSNNLKLVKILNDPRYVSFGYLVEKLILIFPKLSFIFKFLSKIKFLQNINVKVDLKDLKIYYFEKM